MCMRGGYPRMCKAPTRMKDADRLTIGIDARAAAEVPAGRGRVVRELLQALALRDDDCHYLLYARHRWTEAALDERFSWRLIGSAVGSVVAPAGRAPGQSPVQRLPFHQFLFDGLVPAHPGGPDRLRHDPLRARDATDRCSAAIERLTLGPAVRRSAALLCISHATAEVLVRHFPSAAGRTVVAPLCATLASASAAERAALPKPGFVLAVGTLEPRKNLPRLVAAYCSLEEQLQQRHRLVVVGALGWETGETLQALRSLGERCTMLGYVSDAGALRAVPSMRGVLLSVARRGVRPARAGKVMSAGAAVITSDLSSLPEVGGEAVEYIQPTSVASIAGALERLLESPERRARLGVAGCERAAGFSWDRTAQITLEALRRATG